MEETIYLCTLGNPSQFLEKMTDEFTSEFDKVIRTDFSQAGDLSGKKFLFAVQLEELGINLDTEKVLHRIYKSAAGNQLSDTSGAVLIHSKEEIYTKTAASMLVFRLNSMGMSFPGRPMVEAPHGLRNYISSVKRSGSTLEESCLSETADLARRLRSFEVSGGCISEPRILAVHASEEGSNTLYLWNMVKQHLPESADIREIYIPNGEVKDCEGCSYTICKHFAKQKSCYYGGIMVEEVYPEIIQADILVMLCPNYNDALGANLAAMVNRLTAIFRHMKFYDKKLYAVIVSGSSGTEAIATQLIRALNMNKTFQLPPNFTVSAIANDRGSIFEVEGIESRAKDFAEKICGKK